MADWPLIRNLIELDVSESTSEVARAILENGEPELPLVVRANRQTNGRGRGENAWWSDQGSLTFTLALDPSAHGLRADHEPRLALATAVAVIEALGSLGVTHADLGIRWPNDVEVGLLKLAGILPERIETARGHRLLIGIGLNVTTRLDEAPHAVRAMATTVASLHDGFSESLSLNGVLAAILGEMSRVIPLLAADDPWLSDQWSRLDLLRGQTVRVDLGASILSGEARDIDPQGALLVQDGRQLHRLFGGRVLRAPPGEDR